MSAPSASTPSPVGRRWFTPGPLRNNDYRLLFAGQLISMIGNAFYAVALPWYMLTQGGGAANLGLALTAYAIPLGVATLLGGWLSDKLRPRRVMLFADFIRAFILAGLAWLTFGGGAPILSADHAAPLWAIASLTAALGLFDGLFMPASQSITPDLLPDDQLQAANGFYYALTRFAQLIGPSLAGAAVVRFGSPISFALDAATFIVSTITLAAIRGRAHQQAAAPSESATSAAAADGSTQTTANSLWRFAFANSYFLVLIGVLLVGNLFIGVEEVGYPALVNGPLRADAQGYGFMIAANGAGGLVGGLLAGALGRWINRGWQPLALSLLQVAPIAGVAFAPNIYAAIGYMVCFGILNGMSNVSFQTLFQRKAPRNLLGRIWGLFSFCNFAMLPISVAAAGFASAHYGPRVIILVGGAIIAISNGAAFFNRGLRNL